MLSSLYFKFNLKALYEKWNAQNVPNRLCSYLMSGSNSKTNFSYCINGAFLMSITKKHVTKSANIFFVLIAKAASIVNYLDNSSSSVQLNTLRPRQKNRIE